MKGFAFTTIVSLMLFSSSALAKESTTNVYITTEKETMPLRVPLDECAEVPEEPFTSLHTTKKCVVFTAPDCMGRAVQLAAGEHETPEPVEIASIYCQSK